MGGIQQNTNMKPLKEISRKEPIIDQIRMKQILTDNSKIFTINLYTLTSYNEFNGNISLKVMSQDFFFAFVFSIGAAIIIIEYKLV